MARVRARGRDFLVREGDRLADGEADTIGFATPTIAWLRFRRRVDSPPGVPYRPVVWLLAGSGPRSTRGQSGLDGDPPGLAIGEPWNGRLEVHKLEAPASGPGAFPPWSWELTAGQAPRLCAELLALPEIPGSSSRGNRITWGAAFGSVDLRCSSGRSAAPVPVSRPARRDPFSDLSRPDPRFPFSEGPRPRGIPGLLIDEIEIESLFRTPRGALAEARAARGRFFLREGDELWDGDVERIDLRRGVLFKQIETDPAAEEASNRVVKRVDPRWIGAPRTGRPTASSGGPADRRDPFRALLSGNQPPARPPSALAGLTCEHLTFAPVGSLREVLARAEQRLDRYRWERWLAEDHMGAGVAADTRRYLDDIDQAASTDLARLFGSGLPELGSLLEVPRPPPAEMFALLGDLRLLTGEPVAAAEAYRAAGRMSPAYEPVCGRLHGGKLYGAEGYLDSGGGGGPRWPWLTGYLLAWDPGTGRVLERHLLPGPPEAFAAEGEALRISLAGGAVIRLVKSRFEPRSRVAASLGGRLAAVRGGMLLAKNFLGVGTAGGIAPFAVGRRIDDRLPLTAAELEAALAAAAARDPTQPWHRFLLGQARWVQGRRGEAEVLWRELWRRGAGAVPHYEVLWMAAFHEAWGQREWADRLFDLALEQRRGLTRPIALSQAVERRINVAVSWLSAGHGHDPERRYLWWRRSREISGMAPGDAFRAALWAAHWARRGDPVRAREEREFLERARRHPFDVTLGSAWLDYSLYLVLAVAAMLCAQLAWLGGRLARRSRDWRVALRASGPRLPSLLLALAAAASLSLLAASYIGYLKSLPFELGDVAAEVGRRTYRERFELTAMELLRAWLARGIVEPVSGSPAPLIAKAREVGGPRLPAAAGIAVLFVFVPPAALLSWWRRRRAAARGTRRVPGAEPRGVLLCGLVVFAVLPLSWLVVARVWGAVPAPGPVSANFFLRAGLEEPPLPPPPAATAGASDFERLRAASFWRLLFVWPGARIFWSLVLAALVISVGSVRRRGSPRRCSEP